MNTFRSFLFGGPGGATRLADVGLLLTRLSFGLLLAFGHGFGKVWGNDGLGPGERFIGNVEKLGFPAPTAFAWAAALTEFLGGLLLAAGLLTRPVALAIAFNMIIAAFGVHLNDPIVASGGGRSKELALLYMAPAILFLLAGAGRYSLDALIAHRRASGKPRSKPAAT